MTCHNLYSIRCSVSEYSFTVSYYFNLYCSCTIPKSADFTFHLWKPADFSESTMLIFTNPPLPHGNVYHFCNDCLGSQRLYSKQCSWPLLLYVHFCINQGWWHSVQCLLHPGGGCHWDLHLVRAHTPWRSTSVLCNWVSCAISYCGWITDHGVIKALTLCDEAIEVRTSPPSAAHMSAYMAVVMKNCPALNLCPLTGRRNPILPIATPTGWENPTTTARKPWGSCGWWLVTAYGWCLLGGHSPKSWMHPPETPTNTLEKSCRK